MPLIAAPRIQIGLFTALLWALNPLAAQATAGQNQAKAQAVEPEAMILDAGQVHADYDFDLKSRGFGTSADFQVVGGRVTDGLRLERDGRLHGRPVLPGLHQFTLRVSQVGESPAYFAVQMEISPWQNIEPLSCGGGVDFSLSASAQNDILAYDLDLPGAAAFFTLALPADLSALDLHLEAHGDASGILMLPRVSYGPGADEFYTHTLVDSPLGDGHLRLDAQTPYYALDKYQETGVVGITVAAHAPGDFTLNLTCQGEMGVGPDILANGAVGAPYETAFEIIGGIAPYQIRAESLPPGLMLQTDPPALMGTPETAGSYAIALEVEDSLGLVHSRNIPFLIAEPAILHCGESREATFLGRAFEDRAGLKTPEGAHFYVIEAPEAAEVRARATWQGETGGLALFQGLPASPAASADFADYGDPHLGKAPEFEVTARGAYARLADYAETAIPLAVAALETGGAYQLQIDCETGLQWAGASALEFAVDAPVDYAFQTRGGQGVGRSFSVQSGTLPPGLSLDENQGHLNGTPKTPGQYPVEIQVEDEGGETAVQSFTLQILETPCGEITPLTCGAYEVAELDTLAWQNRLTVDLEAAHAYCLSIPEGVTEVSLELTPKSGSNPDLFLGAPGVSLFTTDLNDFALFATHDDVESLSLNAGTYPPVQAYGQKPIPLRVGAASLGIYTLEVRCTGL